MTDKRIIMTSALNRTQVVVNGYVVVDMTKTLFTDGLPYGALLINKRADGHLYADRLLNGRLFGIDGDAEATAAWVEGVELLLGEQARQWMHDNCPSNYRAWYKSQYGEIVEEEPYMAGHPGNGYG